MNAIKNPYVGPRTFRKEEGHLYFGRDREARDLTALVASERLTLFYAQSGAGKSSLVNTRLIPDLEKSNYEVFPVGRVGGGLAQAAVGNIYIYNLARSLTQREIDPRSIAALTLSQFLKKLNVDEDGYFYDVNLTDSSKSEGYIPWRRALIIDQFEEVFSAHLDAWEKREDFFRQLAQAMQDDPYLWVVLVMREDYVAALDPYAHLLPGGLRTRYYMQRLSREAALKAMKNPVAQLRPYAAGVAEKLVDDLCSIKVQKPDGTPGVQPGQYVEPVQLQVACYGLWENLPPDGKQITEKDLQDVGDVNQSLGKYYDVRVNAVAKAKNVKERLIREWFEKKLITTGGIRNMALQELNKKSGGLDDGVIQALQSDLVRAEKRGGATWYELTHDRLVEPILERNKKWFTEHLSPLQRQAAFWKDQNENESWLLVGPALVELENWATAHQDELTDGEREYLGECQKKQREQELEVRRKSEELEREVQQQKIEAAQRQVELANKLAAEQARSASRARRFVIIALGLVVVAVASTILAFRAADQAATEASVAKTQFAVAVNLATSKANNDGLLQEVITTQDAQLATLQASAALPIVGPTNAALSTPTLIGTEIAVETPLLSPSSEEVIGYSAGKKEIRVFKFGSGSRHVVLVGGLHAGFAPSTVLMAEQMKEYLADNPDIIPESITVDVITVANPDSVPPPGLDYAGVVNGRLNANQVDLNRNWDCDWRTDAVWQKQTVSGGTAPFSEPEAIALRDFFKAPDKLTVAVVFWAGRSNPASVSPGGCGTFSVYSDPLSSLYATAAGYHAQDFMAYSINGDATNWLDAQGIGAISVLLPSYTTLSQKDFDANVAAIKQVLRIYGR